MASSGSASLPTHGRDREERQGIHLPPGFRFRPRGIDLVRQYLLPKVLGQPLPVDMIDDIDIYSYEPDQLPIDISNGWETWAYFFVSLVNHTNAMGADRCTPGGHWKVTGPEIAMKDEEGNIIAFKRKLVFYRGQAAQAKKTKWMMNEYRLNDMNRLRNPTDRKMDSYVACKIHTDDPELIRSMSLKYSGDVQSKVGCINAGKGQEPEANEVGSKVESESL